MIWEIHNGFMRNHLGRTAIESVYARISMFVHLYIVTITPTTKTFDPVNNSIVISP